MQRSNAVDTITALATAPGRGGIAIVRVSGPLAQDIAKAITQRELKPREATYTTFIDEKNDIIDEGVALLFPNPHSFTGEDVVEFQGHGGPVVVDLLMQRILSLGARLARPGEFSERAFLNGKMDLAQAEAIADLINASSKQAARSAMRSLQGEFSKTIHALNEKIIYLRTYVEAAIDFTDEEIDFLADEKIASQAKTILSDLISIQRNAKQGNFLREGVTAVIVGEPNVGKSSLLNALSGKETAIVTDIPGTTRDVLRDYILIDGMPMHIIDTAGLRESDDIVEQEGIKRALQEMEKADVVLLVSDGNSAVIPRLDRGTHPEHMIHITNKIDLTHSSPKIDTNNTHTTISLSAKTGAGLDLLKHHIKSTVGFQGDGDGIYLARRRHLDALARAEEFVKQALNQLEKSRSGELAAEDLRQAHLSLCDITGEFTADDLLGKIFSSFCIGK